MTFLRTLDGLTNQALFNDVDIIFYTEGGDVSYSVDEVSSGIHNDFAIDQIFWINVLEKHRLEQKYKILPIGSKSTLLQIANLIAGCSIQNVGVAMDTDYDDLYERKIQSPYILYTYGYSWENDVFDFSTLEHYIAENTLNTTQRLKALDVLKEIIENYIDGCISLDKFNLLYANKRKKKIHYRRFEKSGESGKN